MNNDNSMIILGIIVFIVILLMLLGAFFLLKSHKGGSSGKKVRLRRVKKKTRVNTPAKAKTTARTAVRTTAGKTTAAQPSSSAVKKAAPSKPVPLKGADEGIEKYARMTEDYVRSKFDIELKRVELKKYYSERHGFYCVDFTYRPASGSLPAQFRTHLNDMDTALTNVSGVDTISFAADTVTGTYRTTFYLGK